MGGPLWQATNMRWAPATPRSQPERADTSLELGVTLYDTSDEYAHRPGGGVRARHSEESSR